MSETNIDMKIILEAVLMAASEPLSLERIQNTFSETERPSIADIKSALEELTKDYESRSIEVKELASGFCFRVRESYAPWVTRLWEERPQKYSRAFLETLALIAYRQPITRAEIEKVRGVAVNSVIIKTLLDRGWIRIVGHRDVPGKPSVFATTKDFLDYFSLKSLEELPPLDEIKNLEELEQQLELSLEVSEKQLADEQVVEEQVNEVLIIEEQVNEVLVIEEQVDELIIDEQVVEESTTEENSVIS